MGNLRSNIIHKIKGTDWIMLFLCLIASAFGTIMVYSATLNTLTEGQTISRDTMTMIMAIILGVATAIIISFIDYEIIVKLWPLIAVISLALMLSLFIWGVGPSARSDAKTWLPITSTLYFQPSEIVKISFIITFSVHLEIVGDNINKFRNILFLVIHAMAYAGIVAATGDIGSALVFVLIFIGMMFMANVKLRYFALGMLAILAAIPVVWSKVFSEIQKERFLALIYPDAYKDVIYQQEQCIKAMGSGQIFGKGLFNGSYTQGSIVPESKNDMILSVVGEELGFIGCIGLLILFALMIFKIIRNAKHTRDNPAMMICYGIAFMIASQIIINVGMCLKLLPVIGITLPFMSAGGSSTLCIYIAVGLLMSVYRYNIDVEPVNFRLSNISTPYSNYR